MAATSRRPSHDDSEERNEWGMPRMREPDFSSVRKDLFSPKRVLVFVAFAVIFWLLYFHFFPNTSPKPQQKKSPPAATESQK